MHLQKNDSKNLPFWWSKRCFSVRSVSVYSFIFHFLFPFFHSVSPFGRFSKPTRWTEYAECINIYTRGNSQCPVCLSMPHATYRHGTQPFENAWFCVLVNLDGHLDQLSRVINWHCEAGLKLKPFKCYFIGVSGPYYHTRWFPNRKFMSVVEKFPILRYLGDSTACSYYRQFIVHKSSSTTSPVNQVDEWMWGAELRYLC